MTKNVLSTFFFNDTATTEIYTLSLHDALPIFCQRSLAGGLVPRLHEPAPIGRLRGPGPQSMAERRHEERTGHLKIGQSRSEEHTSELQSRQYLVCRLLLEKKNTYTTYDNFFCA